MTRRKYDQRQIYFYEGVLDHLKMTSEQSGLTVNKLVNMACIRLQVETSVTMGGQDAVEKTSQLAPAEGDME